MCVKLRGVRDLQIRIDRAQALLDQAPNAKNQELLDQLRKTLGMNPRKR